MDYFFVYTDGASRGNPGESACAFLIYDKNRKLVLKKSFYLGRATNNEAEYSGVLLALKELAEMGAKKAIFFLDSLFVKKQLDGEYRLKNERMMKFYLEIKKIIFKTRMEVEFNYISRSENKEADKLVNLVLDKNSKNKK